MIKINIDIISTTIGQEIKRLRNERHLTQEELGNILGVKKSSIQKYESGSVKNIKLETLRLLCEYFRVAPFHFLFPEYLNHINGVKGNMEKLAELGSHAEFIMTAKLYSLNDEARQKVFNYVDDLFKIEEYRRWK